MKANNYGQLQIWNYELSSSLHQKEFHLEENYRQGLFPSHKLLLYQRMRFWMRTIYDGKNELKWTDSFQKAESTKQMV